MGRERLGLIYTLCAVAGYAFLPIFAAGLRGSGIEPLEIAFFRYLFTVPIFWLITLRTARSVTGKPLPRKWLFLLGFLLATEALASFIGLQYLSPGIYLVLYYTFPAMTAILSLFLGERLGIIGWAALVVTLVGVSLTIADLSVNVGEGVWFGVACALVNAALASVYFVVMERLLRGHTETARAGAFMVSGSLVFLTFLTGIKGLTGTITIPTGIESWSALFGLVVVSTVMPIFMLNKGIQAAGASRSAIFGTVEPLMTAVLAQLILGITMQPIQWVGGLLVVFSVILLQLRGSNAVTTPDPIPAVS